MKTRLVAYKAYSEERQREYVGTAVIAFLMVLPLSCVAREFPKVNEEQLAEYREKFKEVPRRKYVLIHADGSQVHERSSFRSLYLLNVLADSSSNVISSQDIHELVEGEFGVDIETDSLLSKEKTDYLVLSMSRPAENNPRYYFRCGGRDGEHRAYLFSISDGKAKVVSKFFGGCATSYELMRDGNDRGYRVIERGEKVRSVRYMLRGDTLVREPDYQEKGSPR